MGLSRVGCATWLFYVVILLMLPFGVDMVQRRARQNDALAEYRGCLHVATYSEDCWTPFAEKRDAIERQLPLTHGYRAIGWNALWLGPLTLVGIPMAFSAGLRTMRARRNDERVAVTQSGPVSKQPSMKEPRDSGADR